ncbi:hypothetical protein [Cellulomonas dongxiuzhuiae]|uniref:hypothetical protein n=1 Tax=Cellulomonas dongxiuzhuiae TaxID=2819979 RepID=UPI001AAF2BAF|nr:hypothetical protein [Cellulomonas dongxiuzhuiae]MBO3089903.1 hypothetical protein [Cellulomonas dongxiuzhuiae]
MSDTGRPGEPEQRPGATGPTHRPAATPQGDPGAASGWAGGGADPATPAVSDPAGPAPEREPGDGRGRPAWLLPVAIGVGAVVVIGVVVGVLVNRNGGDAAPTPAASTVTAPVPTPAAPPAARTATTAFAAALPTTVLQYALESSQEDAERLGAGALEAYTETFTDGDGGTLTVRAAQLETPEDATALLAQVVAGLPTAPAADAPTATASAAPDVDLPQSGEVLVGGAPVGTFTVVDAGDGTGVAVWQNATAVFQVTAPVADVLDVYRAYSL